MKDFLYLCSVQLITHFAFDHGITHFDLANNYGPVYGSAEETMGRLMDEAKEKFLKSSMLTPELLEKLKHYKMRQSSSV